jgi:hypothetical protein
MRKQKLILGLLLFIFPLLGNAQSYTLSGGLRLGNGNNIRQVGLSLQQRFAKNYTAEAILQSDFKRNTTFHLLGKRHFPIIFRRFNVYAGGGLSLGSEQSERLVNNEVTITAGNPTVGADLILGVEFTLARINFSLDYKPNLNLTGRTPWYQGQVGISARHVILKGNYFKKLKRKRKRKKRQKARSEKRAEGNGLLQIFEKQ